MAKMPDPDTFTRAEPFKPVLEQRAEIERLRTEPYTPQGKTLTPVTCLGSVTTGPNGQEVCRLVNSP